MLTNTASHPLQPGAAARAWSAIGIESDLTQKPPQFSIPVFWNINTFLQQCLGTYDITTKIRTNELKGGMAGKRRERVVDCCRLSKFESDLFGQTDDTRTEHT